MRWQNFLPCPAQAQQVLSTVILKVNNNNWDWKDGSVV